jgi:hypothetical protein
MIVISLGSITSLFFDRAIAAQCHDGAATALKIVSGM